MSDWAADLIAFLKARLDEMRREMPYADTLELRLECERRPLP